MRITKKELPIISAAAIVVGLLLLARLFVPAQAYEGGEQAAAETNELRAARIFTEEEVAAFDGKDGAPAYYIYKGKVYDVTASALFEEGEHFGHESGGDLTGALEAAPHGTEVFADFPVVGVVAGSEADLSGAAVATDANTDITATKKSGWRPIIIWGKTFTAWTGYILAIFFILNFVTCIGMPWRTNKLPWKGKIPGPDTLDEKGFFTWTYPHKEIAWLTIIFGALHGTLGILLSFNIVI
jgi:predicted heme/steroid binding protein